MTMETNGVIDEYLSTLGTKSTRRNYSWGIRRFFTLIDQNPNTYIKSSKTLDTIELLKSELIDNGDIESEPVIYVVVCDGEIIEDQPYVIHKQNMELFIKSLRGLSPLSQHLAFTSIKCFLVEHGIDFTQRDLKKFNAACKTRAVVSKDKAPTKEEMQLILNEASPMYKTAFLFMLSSGCRRSELTKLKLEDIDMKSNPVSVFIRSTYTKNEKPRTTYISNECKKYLKQWLEQRPKYLETTSKKLENQPHMPKNEDDPRVFPFDSGNLQKALVVCLRNANLDKRDTITGRHILHSHSFRKFFISELSLVIPPIIAQGLAGHSGYLGDNYNRFSDKQISNFYLEGMHVLQVFDEGVPISAVDEMKIRHEAEIQDIKKDFEQQIHDMKHEILQFMTTPGTDKKIYKEKIKGFKKKSESES